jgi:hypothetical protein
VKPVPHPSLQLKSAQVLVRLGLRLIVMTAFAAFSSIGFMRIFAALLWMSAVLCALAGAIRREQPLAADLNHWDEMTVYCALWTLLGAINHPI